MKLKNKSPLYSYNPRTKSFSFRQKKKKKSGIKVAAAIIIVLIIAGCAALLISRLFADKKPQPISDQSINEVSEKSREDKASKDEEHETALFYDSSGFLTDVPEWGGYAFTYINGNKPDFTADEIWTVTQESLDPLDRLGRCGAANSCIGQDGMPTEPRGDISSVEPSGWHTDRYDFVEGEMLFNRCHLIGHQLSGDDAIPRNLITGTSYLNRDGMLQFENAIASYVRETDNHVMYRVVPIFAGEELIARGVHMEAISVEDDGAGLAFNVFCYNVQPGVDIDYKTGDNKLSEDTVMLEEYLAGKYLIMANMQGQIPTADQYTKEQTETTEQEARTMTYVLNTNSGRFHYPDCPGVSEMADHNKQIVESTREELIGRGFKPCGSCKP